MMAASSIGRCGDALLELSPELEHLVRRIAGLERRSAASVIDEAVRDYAARAEARRGFVAEAEAAWDDYRSTGLHITGPEAERWLESWGAKAKVPAPKCHD